MSGERARLKVKVVPGARDDAVVGWLGERLKLRVSAPPAKGRANAAVTALLARHFDLLPAAVAVVAGHGSPSKLIEVSGLDDAELRRRLAEA